MFLLFLPHFPGAPKTEGYCSQGERLRSGRDPQTLGRNRESRSLEAAGRRNEPEAVPRKTCGRKRASTSLSRLGARDSRVGATGDLKEQHPTSEQGRDNDRLGQRSCGSCDDSTPGLIEEFRRTRSQDGDGASGELTTAGLLSFSAYFYECPSQHSLCTKR